MSKKSREGDRFEKKLGDLEDVVARLESGDTPLEDSLALFEKGTELLKQLTGMLEEAERKVELLSRDSSGTLKPGPFPAGDEDGE